MIQNVLKTVLIALILVGSAFAALAADFTYTPARPNIESGASLSETVTFDGRTSNAGGDSITNHEWDFNSDGTYDKAGEVVTYQFTSNGNHDVTLRVTNTSGGTDTETKTIYVNTIPVASFTVPSVVDENEIFNCDGTLSSDADGDSLTYTWNFGDGTTRTNILKPSKSYSSAGTYTIRLTVNDGYKTHYVEKPVKVNDLPNPRITAEGVVKKNVEVSFSAAGSTDPDGDAAKMTYEWDFDNNGIVDSTSKTPKYTYTVSGTYTVKLSVTDEDGGKASTTTSIRVNRPPTADAGDNVDVAVNQAVTFDASKSEDDVASGLTYSWDFGDGKSDNGKTASHAYAKKGSYTVQLTVTDSDGERDTDSLVAKVIEGPTADINVDESKPIYAGDSIAFDGSGSTGDYLSYSWKFGDTTTATGKTVTHKYTAAGTYNVELEVEDMNDLKDTDTESVVILALPKANAGADRTTVVNTRIDLASTGSTGQGTLSYKWNMGDGTEKTGSTVSHKYTTVGEYVISLTVTDSNGKTDTDTMVLKVLESGLALPVANAGADREVKIDEDIYFQATGTDEDGEIVSYRWNFGDGTTESTEKDVHHDYSTMGTYTVTLTVTDDDGLTATDTAIVRVKSSSEDLIEFVELDNEIVQANEYVEITVETDNADLARITIDGKTYTLDNEGDGEYWGRFRAPAESDEYEIQVKAEKGSEEETKKVTLKVDNDAPEIDSVEPEGEVEDYKNTLKVEINEKGECRFSEENEDFEDMKKMDSDSAKTIFEEDFTINEGESKKFYILCADEIGNEMSDPEVIEIERATAEGETATETPTGLFGGDMAAFQIAIIFVLVVVAIVIVGVYFWQQQQK